MRENAGSQATAPQRAVREKVSGKKSVGKPGLLRKTGKGMPDADVLVIGGGAAGMMAACSAAEAGARVMLLEKNEKAGKKIYITGKGRCNFTNACDPEDFLSHVPCHASFLYSSVYGFDPAAVIAWFEEHGCRTKVERGNRAFPQSDHASDITKALERAMRESGVQIRLHSEAARILFPGQQDETEREDVSLTDDSEHCGEKAADRADMQQVDRRKVTGVCLSDGTVLSARAVVIATGGLSYPTTGSTGDGYRLAEKAGHTVEPCSPSLVPLCCAEEDLSEMQGLSLKNVTLRIFNGKRKAWDGFGEMMFTHFGVTGPLVLTASADLADCLRKGQLKAEIDLKPALPEEKLDERILRAFEQNPNKEIRNVAPEVYPQKMVPVLLRRCRIDPQKVVNSITKAERARLVHETKHFSFTITHPGSFREAVVTHGGVRVREVDPGTMESRKTAGLFFAGEVLDVDAHTGGYNLQIAWSTGRAAGLGAAAYAKSQSKEAE